MIIKDTQGKYQINFDERRNIARDKQIGLWKKEDFERYHKDYVNKVAPKLGRKPWIKISDIREYKTSSISEGLKEHMIWAEKNNFAGGGILVESAIVKMQIKRAANTVTPKMFTSEKEVEDYIKSSGF